MAAENSSSKGQAWFCTTGIPSDIAVDVDDMTFHLHKFPLISKSKRLNDLISEQEAADYEGGDGGESEIESESCRISLPEFPGGSETFEVAAKFCYGAKIELSAANAAALRCAGEVLEMTDAYSKNNLISRTERFLSRSVFRKLRNSIAALKSCENLMPMAEELGIVQRCVDTISAKAAVADSSIFGWPVNESVYQSPSISGGRDSRSKRSMSTSSRSNSGRRQSTWLKDLSEINYDFLSRVLEAMRAREVSSDIIESCLLHYAKKSFPGINRSSRKPANHSSITSIATEAEQRSLLESIVSNLPTDKCSSSARTARHLFGLLRTANILKASEHCKCALERKIGAQLERAGLDDLLIPSYSYLNDTLYDVDCVQRILAYFLESYDVRSSEALSDDLNRDGLRSPAIMLVGKLMDGYLSEIASDANLRPEQFRSLGSSLPDQARLFDDGLYRAVDLYLKAHPWTTESERERICEVMDSQKLTLEACAHAAKNERLPLRAVVQVLFFEQLQLRNAIASTFLVDEGGPIESLGRLSIRGYNDEEDERGHEVTQQPETRRLRASARENRVLRLDMKSVKTRVHELERECSTMKRVIDKFDKASPSTRKNSFASKFGCKFKTQVCDSHEPTVMDSRRGRYVTSHTQSHYRN